MENNTITIEKLKESLKNILDKQGKSKTILEKFAQTERELNKVKSETLVELTQLKGEERAIRYLLSTVETPKEEDKK